MKIKIVLFVFFVASFASILLAEDRQHINLPGKNADLPFSDGVLVGDTLYIAGRLGLDSETGKPPAEVEKEVRLILDGMKGVLEKAGMTMDDLVSVQVFCTDLSLYDQFNSVYSTYFEKDFPARAFVGTHKLLRDARFEVKGIAVKRH